MATSHITKNHRRRKALVGLTPDDIVKQMAKEASNGPKMRKLQRDSKRQKGKVLSDSRKGSATEARGGGVFATPSGDDAERPHDGQPASVPNAPGNSSSDSGTQLSRVLKRMLGEAPPSVLLSVDGIGRVGTNAEALGAIIQREAFAGKQWAVEMWRDQTEGKPVRAAQVNNTDQEVEDQLDRVSTAALNRLTQKDESK
jgi:hypothetical protein